MKPFRVCTKHNIPLRFDSEEAYNSHMKEQHRAVFFSTLQQKKEVQNFKPASADPYEEYYANYQEQKLNNNF